MFNLDDLQVEKPIRVNFTCTDSSNEKIPIDIEIVKESSIVPYLTSLTKKDDGVLREKNEA